MKYVYLPQSIDLPAQRYVGITNDLQKRLKKHSEGGSPHIPPSTPPGALSPPFVFLMSKEHRNLSVT